MIISIKKNLKTLIKSGQNKLISSELAQKIPKNLAVITSRFLLKFAPKISQNWLILQQICLWKSRIIGLFSVTYQKPW